MKNIFKFFMICTVMLAFACEKTEIFGDSEEIKTAADLNARVLNCDFTPISADVFVGDNLGFKDGSLDIALFNQPFSMAYDEDKKILYVSDTGNHRIRAISDGGVRTLVGGTKGDHEGVGTAAQLNSPRGIVLDRNGNLYVADSKNHKIRKITPRGLMTTFAGSTMGYTNGRGNRSRFNSPTGIAYDDQEGVLYVSDTGNNKIRIIKSDGSVGLFAGSTSGYRDSNTSYLAKFKSPQGIDIGPDGALYVADFYNHKIRRISKTGRTSTFAGSRIGSVNGPISRATFTNPTDIICDKAGNFFVTDGSDPSDVSSLFGFNARVRVISNNKVALLAGRADNDPSSITTSFLYPKGMAIIEDDLYVTSSGLGQIKKIEINYDCN